MDSFRAEISWDCRVVEQALKVVPPPPGGVVGVLMEGVDVAFPPPLGGVAVTGEGEVGVTGGGDVGVPFPPPPPPGGAGVGVPFASRPFTSKLIFWEMSTSLAWKALAFLLKRLNEATANATSY